MANKICVIFGGSGQDGFYLKNLLRNNAYTVINISRTVGDIIGDIKDFEFVKLILKKYQPDFVFHFAATSSTSHNALFENHDSISTGSINILESVRLYSPLTKVFLSGSAMQFKNVGMPINEATEFEASSPYSVARIHSVYAGRYYRDKYNLNIYVGYFFNHDSPLRTERHVNQKIIKAVNRISEGSDEKLLLGNIEVKKEFNFAGDIISAVWILVNQQKVFEAVIGSGEAFEIKDWVKYCFEKKGLKWENHVDLIQNFNAEYDILVSDPKIIKSLGWQNEVDFFQLANMMMDE